MTDIVLECRTCAAYVVSPADPSAGECRRRAPVPVVLHWHEAPELNEHGCVKGFRVTMWPGVHADRCNCMEYSPGQAIIAQLAMKQAEAEAEAAGPLN